MIDLTVLVYNNFGSIMTTISKQNESLNIQAKRENSSMNDVFHGVKITVSGIKITFQLSLNTDADFTSYFINVCNLKGCNVFSVQVKLGSMSSYFFILVHYDNIICLQILQGIHIKTVFFLNGRHS